jgi:hypothetical protein
MSCRLAFRRPDLGRDDVAGRDRRSPPATVLHDDPLATGIALDRVDHPDGLRERVGVIGEPEADGDLATQQ